MALTQVFQNTIAVESFTREAAMIESLGCENLTNLKGRIEKKNQNELKRKKHLIPFY